jgi:hypothetical protein
VTGLDRVIDVVLGVCAVLLALCLTGWAVWATVYLILWGPW